MERRDVDHAGRLELAGRLEHGLEAVLAFLSFLGRGRDEAALVGAPADGAGLDAGLAEGVFVFLLFADDVAGQFGGLEAPFLHLLHLLFERLAGDAAQLAR